MDEVRCIGKEGRGNVPLSLVALVCVSGCTLGPKFSPTAARPGCTFVRFEVGGGERVGYFRAVFAGVSLLAVFAVEAALEEAEPIVKFEEGFELEAGLGSG